MFNSVQFKAMQYSLDALWLKQKVHSNNIANYETPGFKTQSLNFREVFDAEQGVGSGTRRFEASITTNPNTVRPDGNNVSLEKENLELYKTYVQTSALYQKISGQFKDTRYVINQTLK